MAEKREQATPRRRQEARRRGQVARSNEWGNALGLLAVALGLTLWGDAMARQLSAYAIQTWGHWDGLILQPEGTIGQVGQQAARVALGALAPVLLFTIAVGVLGQWLLNGGVLALTPLQPDFSRLSPTKGLGRIWSGRAVVELLKAMLKLILIGTLAFVALRHAVSAFPGWLGQDLATVALQVAGAARGLFWQLAAAFLALAAFDVLYQRWDFERGLRMTREEVRQELRESEGDPQLRARVRRRQREIARQRMLQDVAQADVVVTNPTQYAVALRYDMEAMPAPTVVAKGKGVLAARIRALAFAHDVVILEDPPLARALYAAVKVGQTIPSELYRAVAEILAIVWRIKGRV